MDVTFTNEQETFEVDEASLRAAASLVLADAGFHAGTVSLAIVDDPAIHRLNRQFLCHDYPTDVLSFPLEQGAGYLVGEVVVSADTAAAAAREYHTSLGRELLLYVIHGTLHLVGLDDSTPESAQQMRARERKYLARLGHPSGEQEDTRKETPSATAALVSRGSKTK